MTDSTLELLRLINEEKTANEIATKLNISNKQLYNRITMLKNKGFDFEKKYYHDGNIIYSKIKKLLVREQNEVKIITKKEGQTFRAIIISDLHIGNELQRLDLLDKVYDYCTKEGIHIIINGGDLIDGTFSAGNQKYKNPTKQIDYLLKVFPFDKNILNFTLLGNHDFSVLNKTGQDLAIVLQSYRHDIIPVGYEFGKINIKDSSIFLKHEIDANKNKIKVKGIENSIILEGHSHQMKIVSNSINCNISIPSLSDINWKNTLPTILKLDITFNNKKFYNVLITQLLINDKIYILNETISRLNRIRNDKNEIKNEKKLVKEKEI